VTDDVFDVLAPPAGIALRDDGATRRAGPNEDAGCGDDDLLWRG